MSIIDVYKVTLLAAGLTIWVISLWKYLSARKSPYPVPELLKDIGPVDSDFSWENEKPRPYRPFNRGPYHMTMGIKTLDHSEWLLLENTYKDITDKRKKITQNELDHTVLTRPEAKESVFETYDLCLNYMMRRYPQYFAVDEKDSSLIHNKIRNEKIHRDPSAYPDTETLIRTLAHTIEEDFLILIFDDKTEQYYLKSGSFAFPSGFDPAQKIDLSLKDIHGPVPLYKKTIEKAMDKFFRRLKIGEWVYRLNWGVQSHDELYAPDLNHASEEEVLVPLNADDVDFSDVFLRCEKQCLLRLPKTKALLFTIRTYVTPFTEIREEEDCLDLCDAIDNLPDSLAQYKKSVEWGGAVKSYLRRESNGREKSV
ncbi:hypothetical protein DV495_003453 [Geotrichum candidum]|nr:hypothetical protein DV454_000901 [Geotrichum candidum]KAF5126525.1 hypothetical protein DV495_003453 [Geotrichum candidum]